MVPRRVASGILLLALSGLVGCAGDGAGPTVPSSALSSNVATSTEPSTTTSSTVATTTTVPPTTSSTVTPTILPLPTELVDLDFTGIRIELVESAWETGEGSGEVVMEIRESDIASWTLGLPVDDHGIRLVDTQMETDLYELVVDRERDLSILVYVDDEPPIRGRVFFLPTSLFIEQLTLMVGYWHLDPNDPDDFAMYLQAGPESPGPRLERLAWPNNW